MYPFTRRRASQVFTPGELPLKRNNIYVSRDTSEESLERAIERNWCPVVFGDYGVGKSSMVRRFFQEQERTNWIGRTFRGEPKRGRVVYFASTSGLTMPKVFERVLEHLNYSVETEVTRGSSSGVDLSFTDSTITAALSRGRSRERVSKLVVSAPTDEGMLRIIDSARLTIIIDELHQASPEFRAELVPFIKASRVSAPNSNLVLIGTSADALALVASDKGIDRFIADTPVRPMSTSEAQALILNGFKRLRLEIDERIVATTISVASGAPFILQSLCLDMAESSIGDGRRAISEIDLTRAVQRYIQDKNGRMARKYIAAIETQGAKRYRKRILQAIASLDDDYATMEGIQAAVSKLLATEVPSTALSGPLKDLKRPEFGSILQGVDRETGGQIQNISIFTDPMMKSYVRFIGTITDAQIVDEDSVRQALSEGPSDEPATV